MLMPHFCCYIIKILSWQDILTNLSVISGLISKNKKLKKTQLGKGQVIVHSLEIKNKLGSGLQKQEWNNNFAGY